MANQLRVTLISTELAYIVFAVSISCSTMELQGLLVIWQPFFFSQTLRGRRAKYPTRPESAA